MKALLEEFGNVLLYILIAILLFSGIWYCINTDFAQNVENQLGAADTIQAETNESYLTKSRPQLIANESIKINAGATFDVIETPGLKALDGSGIDIISKLLVYGEISGTKFDGNDWLYKRNVICTTPGVYTLRYSIRDSNGFYSTQKIQIIVEAVIS